jgi:probable rRNA maturation factor
MSVELNNESGVEVDQPRVLALANYALDYMNIHPDADLAISFTDEATMEKLHIEWMDEPGPTDVLSFPMDELRSAKEGEEFPSGILGDIVLCPEFARKQATEAGRTLDGELQFLTTHGLLHLLGHDHMTPEEYDIMFALQDQLLAKWNSA